MPHARGTNHAACTREEPCRMITHASSDLSDGTASCTLIPPLLVGAQMRIQKNLFSSLSVARRLSFFGPRKYSMFNKLLSEDFSLLASILYCR